MWVVAFPFAFFPPIEDRPLNFQITYLGTRFSGTVYLAGIDRL
jgi:hypothetical protein